MENTEISLFYLIDIYLYFIYLLYYHNYYLLCSIVNLRYIIYVCAFESVRKVSEILYDNLK